MEQKSFKKELNSVNKDIGNIFSSVGFNDVKISTVAQSIDIKELIIKRVGERSDSIDVTI